MLKADKIQGRRFRVYGDFFFEKFDCEVDLETRTTTHPKALAPAFKSELLSVAEKAEKSQ